MEPSDLQNASLGLGNEDSLILSLEEEKKRKRKQYLLEYQRKYRKQKVRKEVFLTPKDFALVQKSAKAHHQKISTHIRTCALAYIRQEYIVPHEKLLAELIGQVRAIGRNVNQIAYRANTIGVTNIDELKLQQELLSLEEQIDGVIRNPPNLKDLLRDALIHSRMTFVELQNFLTTLHHDHP